MATDDATLAAGVRWLATKRVTLGVVALLLAVFAVELVVWWTFGPRTWQFLFLANATPSPGWFLSPFAHRSVEHLLTTAAVVLVYGGLVETVLADATYAAFYLAAGYASTVAQLGVYFGGGSGLGTLGASGAALGLVTLYVTVTLTARLRGTGHVSSVELLFATSGACIAGLVVANDFVAGLRFAAGTAPYGHVAGMLTGVFYGLVRARTQDRRGRMDC